MGGNDWPARVFDLGNRAGGASGILIDPRRVLTCAHVVEDMKRPAVSFPARPDLGDIPVTAEIAEGWRAAGHRSADLAVLTLRERVPIRPARFAALDALDTGLRELVAIGFPRTRDGHGRIASVTPTTSELLLDGTWMQLESARGFGPNVGPGYSGGAVALKSTLEVVGMVTAADQADRTGLMLPLSRLVHYRSDLADLMPLGPISPDDHRTLRALLRDRPLANPDHAYRDAVDDDLLPDLPDTLDIDSAYALARYIALESNAGDGGARVRAALARLCERTVDDARDPRPAALRRAWGGPPPAAPRPPASLFRVSVHLSRSGAGAGRMLLEVAVTPPGGPPDFLVSEPLANGRRAQGLVQDLLPPIIDKHVPPDGSLLVEFVLPRTWLSTAVDEWTLGRGGPAQIGTQHPVVVRDRARTHNRQLAIRSAALNRSGAGVVRWVGCGSPATATQLAASLALDPQVTLLALANPPALNGTSAILRAGFDCGLPAVLWRREPCTDHGAGGECAGQRFEIDLGANLAGLLDRAPISGLPEMIWRIRAEAKARGTGPHGGHGLTLLWDPAEPPAAPPRLAMAD
jgi:hypothetical protein